ncbi:hypothetical protein GM526_13245 [Enterococcus avium]|uniref:hypothetical protein n=1 Tax=Enterococcus avium TaxID=33945 RepID=UPI00159DEB61|nr:hypothetical protein [Enterococcus avium]NVN78024.1 hypothetical protein [Enterococcus avium]
MTALLGEGGIATWLLNSFVKRPKFLECESFMYGEFEPDKGIYDSLPRKSTNSFSHAVENRIWIENSSENEMRITSGKLRINEISDLEEDKLQMIVGTEGNRCYIYIVNNTFTDIGKRYFEWIPCQYYETYPTLDKEGMGELFQTDTFVRYLEKIPSGSVFKLFEFEFSPNSEKILKACDSAGAYLFYLRQYNEMDEPFPILSPGNSEKYLKQLSNQVFFYYEDGILNYGYFSQGKFEKEPAGINSIPIIYVDTSNTEANEYNINVNNRIGSKDTECLLQYIVPNRSCTLDYSIELKVNGKKMKSQELLNRNINIRVPVYSIEEGNRARNEEAFSYLIENEIDFLFVNYTNEFTSKFKYDPKKWIAAHYRDMK